MKSLKLISIGLAVFAVVIGIWTLTLDSSKYGETSSVTSNTPAIDVQSKPTVAETWMPAAGNLWTGVTLYFGPKKMLVGEVMGGSADNISFGDQVAKGVLIKMSGGTDEWKSRDAIVGGAWYVRSDDAALKNMKWRTFHK